MQNSRLIAALAGVLWLPQLSFAAKGTRTVEELTDEADRIVLGSVVSKHSRWTADSLIYTNIVVAADVTIKGDNESVVTLETPGGVIGDTRMTVSDAAEFSEGERVLLFLGDRKEGRYRVVGRDDGKRDTSRDTHAAVDRVIRHLEAKNNKKLTDKRSDAEAWQRLASPIATTTTATATTACSSTNGLRWSGGAATYSTTASVPAAWTSAIGSAAATWAGAGAAFTLSNQLNSPNQLTVLDLVAKYGSAYSNTYALATVWSTVSTNNITKASIEINNRFAWSAAGEAGKADVQNILTHEFGHWTRMADIYDPVACSEVTMWGTSPLGETKKRTLEQADIDALVALYGRRGTVSAPGLAAPANGATAISTGATLTWALASGATSYDVYFGTSAAPPLAATVAATTWKPAALLNNTRYYWRVVAKNGAASATSATWSFTTVAGALQAPTLLAPANGATGVPSTATFRWNAVSGATTYDVYLGTTSSPPLLGSIAGTTIQISGLTAGRVYYWKIVARSSTGSATSVVWSFRS